MTIEEALKVMLDDKIVFYGSLPYRINCIDKDGFCEVWDGVKKYTLDPKRLESETAYDDFLQKMNDFSSCYPTTPDKFLSDFDEIVTKYIEKYKYVLGNTPKIEDINDNK